VWYAFAAGFLPFFNVYLRNRMGASLETIGGIFAATQGAQALAVLLMAPLIAWLRLVRAVVLTQLLAAAALFALWPVETLPAAAALYLVYLSFQVMSEPGLQSLLMSRMQPEERATASAANLLLMFGMQALAGAAAGALIAARGYSALFIALGATGLMAAALFGGLFARAFPAETAPAASEPGSSPARRE
jgi:predicted MFS family arabinose efflux permease